MGRTEEVRREARLLKPRGLGHEGSDYENCQCHQGTTFDEAEESADESVSPSQPNGMNRPANDPAQNSGEDHDEQRDAKERQRLRGGP